MDDYRNRIGFTAILLACLAPAFSLFPANTAEAKLKVLHSFCSDANCADGANPGPQAPLLRDSSGNLYGTTATGGDSSAGTVFEVAVRKNGSWRFKRLYSFCGDKFQCADGDDPWSNLVMDVHGNLYGVTRAGGTSLSGGVVYEIIHRKTGWKEKVLYAFCSQANCSDGIEPGGITYIGAASGKPYDGVSPLYGVVRYNDHDTGGPGLVFSLTPNGRFGWTYAAVYTFCAQQNCLDGASPESGVIMDAAGNLVGTTISGGATSQGVLFELSSAVAGAWQETVLHSFCSQANCTDGFLASRPAIDASGNIFGTTRGGGSSNNGALYEFASAAGQYSVLYSFCSQQNCSDGRDPNGDPLIDAAGNVYGTTFYGGAHSSLGGTVFEYSNGSFNVLYSFCALENCADGQGPYAGVVSDGSGNLFGVTEIGGAHSNGTVFKYRR